MRNSRYLWFKCKIRAWRDIEITMPITRTIWRFIDSGERIELENSSKDIRIMLLTIGFPRSGSSLLGYLLTAHPYMVVGDEALETEGYNVPLYSNLDKIFNQILEHDYNMPLRSHIWSKLRRSKFRSFFRIHPMHRMERYTLVPNQYQGSCKQLKVIGNKDSQYNTQSLDIDTLKTLKKNLKKKNIVLKYIFTVRNPYDIHSTELEYGQPINKLIETCMLNKELLKQIDSQDVFYARHEDMVANPRSQLAKICDFLQVSAPPDYLDDCASVVDKKPHKSRLRHDWTKDEKQTIASLIEKYDFFSEYDHDT